MEVHFKLLPLQKRNDVTLFWYATLILSASAAQNISVHGMASMALMCVQIARLIEPVYFVAQGADLECNAASDGKPIRLRRRSMI